MIRTTLLRPPGVGILLLLSMVVGCHTYEVRQFDSVKQARIMEVTRAAVIMNPAGGDAARERNKLFTEQLIVSLQKRGIDVAEREKVEALLVDATLIENEMADLTETERAKKLGRLLKADIIIYGDAINKVSYYKYFKRAMFNNNDERFRLQRQANESGVVERNGYPVLANHAIGLSMRAVDSATGEIVWVGYRFLASAKMVDDDRPGTMTNFDVIRGVCDEIVDDLLTIRKS